MKKVMLIYPPGAKYQRGEDRCQLAIDKSSVNAMRACNDLGYASSILKNDFITFLKDYPSEKLELNDFIDDINKFQPDAIFISITNASIFEDIEIANKIKKINEKIVVILKGAIFFNCSDDIFAEIDFSCVDYMIGGEEEFIIKPLLDAHYNDKQKLATIQGIIYKENGKYIVNKVLSFDDDLDSLPFPDRSSMNNKLYVMPDTDEPLATISSSRGCPSQCIYCLSPIISGRKVRFRSPQNILDEMEECYFQHNIKCFFFKADTFTINKKWTLELCEKIINSKIANKVRWVANSRVDTVDEEMLSSMKKAGCYLVAFGLESGSNDSLKKMKKHTSAEKNYEVIKIAKKVGLQTLGFYVLGFPWETKKSLEETKKAIFKNNTDFIEVHIATPFIGTELYKMINENTSSKNVYGKNHFDFEYKYFTDIDSKYVSDLRKKITLKYYTRPTYIIKKCLNALKTPKILVNYIKYGLRLVKNSLIN